MDRKSSDALGVTFTGSVTFNGPMFDIHDNQHVHIGVQMPEQQPQQQEAPPEVPPLLDTPRARELWQKAIAEGWVNEQLQPLLSRPMAALMADRMAEVLDIAHKWKLFEQLWHRNNMRSDYNTALEQKKSLLFQEKLKNILI